MIIKIYKSYKSLNVFNICKNFFLLNSFNFFKIYIDAFNKNNQLEIIDFSNI